MDIDHKACFIAALIVITYLIHQLTVGGDGIIFASVIGAIFAVAGYAYRAWSERTDEIGPPI